MSQTEWSKIEPSKGEEKEKVEFEIEGEEENQPNKVEAEKPEIENTKEVKEEKEDKEEIEGIETSGAQKRIRQLVKQRKEREAQIEELIQQQKQMQLQLQQREQEYQALLNNNVESNEKQVTERIELAKSAYRQAVESGDADKIVEAQQTLNNAQIDSTRLSEFKKQAESFEPVQYTEEQLQQTYYPQAHTENAQIKAQEWAERNSWFQSDRVLTAAAIEIDNQVVAEGFDPSEDDYYEEIDKRLALTFPNKFNNKNVVDPVPQETSQPAQVVAGASRTSSASSSKKVKLTQEDVRLADKWGISLEQYAAEKLKVEKAEGEYTTINR